MEITYLGHSAFRVRGRDVTIVTDPFPPHGTLNMGKVVADIVTVSHGSPNHSFTQGVGNDPKVVLGPGEYEIADVLIAGVATSVKPGVGPANTAYILRFDDLAVCHLGDLDAKLSDKQVEGIGNIDVLFVPVGGSSALGPANAAEVIAQLEPSLVVPMHYSVNGESEGRLQPVEHFAREMGLKEFVAEPRLTVTKSTLPSEVRIIVMEMRRI